MVYATGENEVDTDFTKFELPVVEKDMAEEEVPKVKAVKVTEGGIEVDEEILYKDESVR